MVEFVPLIANKELSWHVMLKLNCFYFVKFYNYNSNSDIEVKTSQLGNCGGILKNFIYIFCSITTFLIIAPNFFICLYIQCDSKLSYNT